MQATDGVSLASTAPENAPATYFDLVITETFYATEAEDPGDPAWTLGVPGDQATSGAWERPNRWAPPTTGSPCRPMTTTHRIPGWLATSRKTEPSATLPATADVDDGCTTLLSPVFQLSTAERAFVTYWRWFGQDGFTVDDDSNTHERKARKQQRLRIALRLHKSCGWARRSAPPP